MKKLIYIPIVILFAVFAFTFSIKNQQIIQLSYYFDIEKSVSLVVLLGAALAIGMLIGCLAMSLSVFKSKRQASKAKKQLTKIEKEVENLRAMPINNEV